MRTVDGGATWTVPEEHGPFFRGSLPEEMKKIWKLQSVISGRVGLLDPEN